MSRIGGGGDEDKTKVPETGTNGSGHSKIGGGSDTSTSSTDDVIKALTGKKLDFAERQAEAADRYNPYSSNPEVARLQRQRDIILNSSNANDPRAKSGLAEIDKLIGQAEQKARIEKLPKNIVTGNTQFLSPLTPFEDIGRNVIPQSAITPMANGYDGSGMYTPYNTEIEDATKSFEKLPSVEDTLERMYNERVDAAMEAYGKEAKKVGTGEQVDWIKGQIQKTDSDIQELDQAIANTSMSGLDVTDLQEQRNALVAKRDAYSTELAKAEEQWKNNPANPEYRSPEQKALTAKQQTRLDEIGKRLDELSVMAGYATTDPNAGIAITNETNQLKAEAAQMLRANRDLKAPSAMAGAWLGGSVMKGVGSFDQSVTEFLDKTLGLGDLLGEVWAMVGLDPERNPITALNRRIHEDNEKNAEYFGTMTQGNKGAQTAMNYGQQTVAAIPAAILAYMTAGSSMASTAGLTTSAYLNSLSGAEQTVAMVGEAVKQMTASPNFLVSFMQESGNSYENALNAGMSDADAAMYSMLYAYIAAMVEVGGTSELAGGTQQFAQKVAEGPKGVIPGLAEYAKSIVGEMGEESVQGMLERGLQAPFGVDTALYSNDPTQNAIIKPNEMLEEAKGAAVVSALMGGPGAIINTVNSIQQNQQTEAPAPVEAPAEAPTVNTPVEAVAENAPSVTPESVAEALAPMPEQTQTDTTSLKERQNAIIQAAHPANPDSQQTWINSADDIMTFDEATDGIDYDVTPDYTAAMIEEAKQSGYITVYSSNNIRNGTFVTPSKMLAQDYAGGGDVHSMRVKLSDVAWIDEEQGQYARTSSRFGNSTKSSNITPSTQAAITEEANSVADALASVDQTSIDASNVSEETGVNIPVEQSASETQNNAENEDVYRERGESRNIRTDDARAEELRNFKEQNPDMYKVVRNEKTLQKALDIFDSQGVEGSAATLEQALADARNGKKLPLEMVPLHKLVCDELAKAGQVERANRISSDLGAELTYAGQLGQANIILRNSSATARADAFAKTLDKLIGENKAAIDPESVQDLVDRYRAAENDEARDAILDDAITAIAQSSPTSFLEAITAIRYLNMLGNFKTQIRNVVGNTGMLVAARAKNRVLAVEQMAANAVWNMIGKGDAVTQTNTLTTNKELFSEAWKMFAEDQKAAYGEGKYSDVVRGNKAIQDKKTVFKWNWKGDAETQQGAILRKIADAPMKVLEAYRKATGWAMEEGDVIFQKVTYAQVLADYAKAQGYKSLADVPAEQLQTMREYAIKEAQEATFHDKNAVSEYFSGFDRDWASKYGNVGRLARGVMQGVVPFRQTPANVGVRMEEYSPLGLINTFVDTVNAIQGKKDVNSVLNTLAKTVSGSGLAALGFILAKNGLARGKEDDEKLANYERNVQGLGDYSIVLPDGTTVSLDWLQPESASFFVGVEAAKYFDDGVQADDFMSLLGSTTDIALNMSFLSGLSGSLEDIAKINGDKKAVVQYLLNSLLSYGGQVMTNSLLGQAEQASEQYRQTTYTDPDSPIPTNVQKVLGKMSAKTPGLDYNQADYIDAWGRRQDNGPVAGRIAESFFSPAYINENRSTDVDDELKRLHEAVGNEIEGTVFPSSPARSTEINGVRLSPEEYETYAVTGGQKALELVTDFINSPGYADLDDKTKAETIKKLYGYAKLDAKNAVLEARGEEPETDKGYEKAKAVMDAAGMSWGEYLGFDATVPKKYEDLARFLLDSDFTEEQQEALYDIYNTSKTPFSTFRDKEQAAKDAGFESADVFEAMLADVKAFKANVKNEYDSNGNVEAAEYIRDQDLTDEQKDTLIGEVSTGLKDYYNVVRGLDVGANDAIDLLLAIDATTAKGSTQNNGDVSQGELIAYFYAHPEDEWLISAIWNSKERSKGDWDTAKGKNFK